MLPSKILYAPGHAELADFSGEFFANKALSAGLTAPKYRKMIRDEYDSCCGTWRHFYQAYKLGILPAEDRNPNSREFIRRLGIFAPKSVKWYFDGPRKVGDVFRDRGTRIEMYAGALITASFSNHPVSTVDVLKFGTTHVAVGFVDLGVLLDSNLVNAEEGPTFGIDREFKPLHFHGYESSAYAVAKSSIVWEMIASGGARVGASEVVQVWFSAVWTKQATLAFLATAKSVLVAHAATMHPEVLRFIKHWAQSKGVGLRSALKGRLLVKKDNSAASLMKREHDRVEMIRYYLTGEFGLSGGAGCSGSITMWDNPNGAPPLQRDECVFNTTTVRDVVESKFWDSDGHYFRVAEDEKIRRVSNLMSLARAGNVVAKFKMAVVAQGSVAHEIASLRPQSISWSNIVDYMYFKPADFHQLARDCSFKNGSHSTVHFGYSMNWPRWTYGAAIMDIATTAECMELIGTSTKAIRTDLSEKVFSLPLRQNTINTTARLLAERCYKSWVAYFFEDSNSAQQLKAKIAQPTNPLCNAHGGTISLSWLYGK